MVHYCARGDRAGRPRTGTGQARPNGLPVLVCLLAVPLLLTLLAVVVSSPRIEDDLTRRSRDALGRAGLHAVGVSFDGRDGVLTGVPDDRRRQAVTAVNDVDGVRAVTVAAATGNLGLALHHGSLVVSGSVPDERTRASVIRQAEASAGGRTVVDGLAVVDGALLPGNPDRVGALVTALAAGQKGERRLTWNGHGVALTGEVPDDAAGTAVTTGVAEALPGIAVTGELESAKAKLQARIARYLAGNPIEFRPESADLTANGRATVHHVAGLLADASDVWLRLDGHVQPGRVKRTESSPYQRRLSEQRAETVKQALVALGVAAERITTRGFGQDGPNPGRRVDITIQ